MSEKPVNDASVAERVLATVARTEQMDDAGLRSDTRLEEDLGMDSLSRVELQMALEEEFGVELPDDDASELRTIGDIVRAVEAALG